MQPCYRRTKSGQWVVMGPTDVIRPGATVEVVTKAGKVKVEHIASVGAPFDRDGVECVYGYPDESYRRYYRRYYGGGKPCVTGGNCSSFGNGRSCGGYDCDGW
jgi:hypothetical protein